MHVIVTKRRNRDKKRRKWSFSEQEASRERQEDRTTATRSPNTSWSIAQAIRRKENRQNEHRSFAHTSRSTAWLRDYPNVLWGDRSQDSEERLPTCKNSREKDWASIGEQGLAKIISLSSFYHYIYLLSSSFSLILWLLWTLDFVIHCM